MFESWEGCSLYFNLKNLMTIIYRIIVNIACPVHNGTLKNFVRKSMCSALYLCLDLQLIISHHWKFWDQGRGRLGVIFYNNCD